MTLPVVVAAKVTVPARAMYELVLVQLPSTVTL